MEESPAGAALQGPVQSSKASSMQGAQSAALILQALQSLSTPPDAASAPMAPLQSESRNSSAESGVATAVHQRKVILHRYASASEQVASALSASRTQSGETMSPQPSAEHAHSPEQEQCIQQLRDRVRHHCGRLACESSSGDAKASGPGCRIQAYTSSLQFAFHSHGMQACATC